MENRCRCCGDIVPEGREVCPTCVRKADEVKPVEKKEQLDLRKFDINNPAREWRSCEIIVLAILLAVIVFAAGFVVGNACEVEDTSKVELIQPTEAIEPIEPEEPVIAEPVPEKEPEPSPEKEPEKKPEKETPKINKKELEMLACVIYQEAGGNGSCDNCRRYVADIVLNRIKDKRFPNTMEKVLTAKRQYGRFYWTGIKWPARAKNASEKKAVERAYRIAEEVLSGKHSKVYGKGYIWQAGFKQGTDGFWCCGHYYGR